MTRKIRGLALLAALWLPWPAEARDPAPGAALTELRSFNEWKRAFDAAPTQPRLVLLVSPT